MNAHNKKYNTVALTINSPIFARMYRSAHAPTRQLFALLLFAVMVLVHAVKTLHVHAPSGHSSCLQELVVDKAGVHHHCSICEFQLAQDSDFTGTLTFRIAPVHVAPTYAALLTAINPHRLFTTEGRGPPRS